MRISPHAIIHPDARIGKDVRIDAFTTIESDVEIGEGSWIMSHACVMSGTSIGSQAKIHQGAIIGGDSQDRKYKGGPTPLKIGHGVTIREYCTINRSTTSEGMTVVGDNCLLMAYVHIAHDCQIGHDCIIANAVNIAGHVTLGSYATIGGMTAIQQYIQIGQHAYVGGGALIRKDVPPYVRAAREPVAYVGINKIGLQRRGFSDDDIIAIQDIYRSVFVHSNNISQSMQILEDQLWDNPFRQEVMSFIVESPNGVIRGFRKEE